MRKKLQFYTLLTALPFVGVSQVIPISAQQAPETAHIGIIGPGFPIPTSQTVPLFRKALADLGYSEGKNLVVKERWRLPNEKDDWLRQAIAEIEGENVHAIFAFGAIPARALKAAGTKTSSVFIMVIPTAEFVSNPEKPEGNLTGFTNFDPNLSRQELILIKQVVPTAKRIAFLGDEAVGEGPFKPHENAARSLGLEPLVLKVRGPKPNFDDAFSVMQREKADALVVLLHPIIAMHRKAIGEYALKFRLPSLFAAGFADAGGLLTYGTELNETVRPAAEYIDRILKGAKPSDLPVRAIVRHRLIVNLRTAEALSITVPTEILSGATEVLR